MEIDNKVRDIQDKAMLISKLKEKVTDLQKSEIKCKMLESKYVSDISAIKMVQEKTTKQTHKELNEAKKVEFQFM